MLNDEGGGGPTENPCTEFVSGQSEPWQIGLPNYWINTANLNLVIQDRIYGYKGLGPGIECILTFNSLGRRQGMFGINWSLSEETVIETEGDEIRLFRGSGQILRYRRSPRQGNPTVPVELNSISGSPDRLLDYGQFWLYIPKQSRAMFRYEKGAGTSRAFLVSVSDYDGNTLKYEFNPDRTLSRIVDTAGRVTVFGYAGGDGLCTSLCIPDGREARFSYDKQHRLIQVSDLQGVVVIYTYGPDNAIVRMVIGEDRKTTEFSYGKAKGGRHLAAVQDAAGNITRYDRASETEVRVTDPEGNTTSYMSRGGRTEQVVDPLGGKVVYTYASGHRVGMRNRNGAQIRKEYDGRGNVIRIEDPEGHSTCFDYDAYDNPIRRRDALGGVLTYSYDSRQHLERMVTPTGRTFQWNYDQKGQLIAMTDPAGNVTTMEYDRFGNLGAVRDPGGYRYQIRYDTAGLRILEVLHPGGGLYHYEYDGNDRITAVHHPDGTVTRYRHGCCAPLSVTDEQGNTVSFTRNSLLYVLARTDALGNRTRYQYNRNNALIGMTDPLGRTISLTCDAADRVVQATDPAGHTMNFAYDAEDNLINLIDPRGSVTTFQYDASNRRVQITDSLRRAVRFGRDPLGRLARVVNARGMVMEYRYDADGRLAEKLHGGNRVATYGYAPAGNPAAINDTQGSTRFEYDSRRHITRIGYPGGTILGFSYNEDGKVREMRYPGNLTVSYTYDLCGRVTRITWGAHFYARSYNATGNVVRETRSNGVESVYEYDPTQIFTRISHAGRTGTIADLTYHWDAAGNVIEESGFLPQPSHPSSGAPEPAQAASYNTENQILSWGMRQFRYDEDGNRTAAEGDGQIFSADYDPENRPVRIATIQQSLQFTYNGMGDLVRTIKKGLDLRDHYTPEGRLVVRTDGNETILHLFIYCEGRLIAMVGSGGETLFYHFDNTGNTLALTDDTGMTVAEYAYDEFGAVIGKDGDAGKNPFTYAGEFGVIDMGDDLFFMRHRFYDATTGSFLQKDPIRHLGGANLYNYVGGNPVSRVDPQGTGAAFCALLFGITVASAMYLTFCAARKFGEQNPIVRTLQVSQQANADANTKNAQTVSKDEFFNHPDHGMIQVMTTTGDQALTANPVTNPGWSLIKGAKSAAEGKPVDAALNTLSAFPDGMKVITGPGKTLTDVHQFTEIDVGSLFTAGGQVKSICTDPPPGR